MIRSISRNINFIDLTLTPKNARLKGYNYIDDIIYEEGLQNEINEDIQYLVDKEGCLLGSPSDTNATGPYFGLYMPVGK